jgi:hypothetical protein
MFTAISLVTLAIGIGANAAIFSVIEGVLLKPLPYPHPERLIALWHTAPGVNIKDLNMAPSLYFIYRDESHVFDEVSMWTSETSSVTGLAEPEEVPALLVTNRLLPILDVQPAVGRRFTPADDDPKNPRTVMLRTAIGSRDSTGTGAWWGAISSSMADRLKSSACCRRRSSSWTGRSRWSCR